MSALLTGVGIAIGSTALCLLVYAELLLIEHIKLKAKR
jgi:hypothetical protein